MAALNPHENNYQTPKPEIKYLLKKFLEVWNQTYILAVSVFIPCTMLHNNAVNTNFSINHTWQYVSISELGKQLVNCVNLSLLSCLYVFCCAFSYCHKVGGLLFC